MAASINLNVARWTALTFGVVYGLWHSSSLKKSAEKESAAIRYRHKEELINKAKAAYYTPKKTTTDERVIDHYAKQGAGAH
ncbi:22923_t:CDS:2 [Cetraspora pellucida]|uniref:ATP synthase F(0) complex subunit e, mitochondrial n=1 Tax=Cetraspora pellucida TaxID=1433469 RepID=A0A9N9A4R5_9GLOM|nr:22923_t:CDS:2 [Cetraspora pellucida]